MKGAEEKPLVLVAFGDSTTAERPSIKQVYAQRLAEELPKVGIPVRVINSGVGGNTTRMAQGRFEKDVLAHNPDLVVILFGINDSAIDVWEDPPATESRVPLAQYEENLRGFARSLRARGAQVILMTPNPLRWVEHTRGMYGKPPYDPDDPDGFCAPLLPYVETVRNLARSENVPLVDVFQAFREYGAAAGRSVDDLLPDGMHPNDEGHRIIADLLIQTILGIRKPAAPESRAGNPSDRREAAPVSGSKQ